MHISKFSAFMRAGVRLELFLSGSLLACLVAGLLLFSRYAEAIDVLTLRSDTEAHKVLAAAIFSACEETESAFDCYQGEFNRLTEKFDAYVAVRVLEKLQLLDAPNTNNCHLVAHQIAHAETRKDFDQWRNLLRALDPDACTGGYLHGVLEAYMAHNDAFKLGAESFPFICEGIGKGFYSKMTCAHSLGHLMLTENLGNIEDSVSECGKVRDNGMRYECFTGTFMENITRTNLEPHGLGGAPEETTEDYVDDLVAICREYDHNLEASRACWQETVHSFQTFYGNDYGKIYKKCYSSSFIEQGDECYLHGTAIMSSTMNLREDRNGMCREYAENDPRYKTCVLTVVGALLVSSSNLFPWAAELCLDAPARLTDECFEGVRRNIAQYGIPKKNVEEPCRTLPEKYQWSCL